MFRGNNRTARSEKDVQLRRKSALTSLVFTLIVLASGLIFSDVANTQERKAPGKTPQTSPTPASFDPYANLDTRLGEKLQDNEAEITRKIAEVIKTQVQGARAAGVVEDTLTQTSATQQRSEQSADKNAIRPFHVNVPKAELTELRRRINATKWPERETVTDASLRW